MGGHQRNAIRTLKEAARELWEWGKQEAKKSDEEREDRFLSPTERARRRRLRLRSAA